MKKALAVFLPLLVFGTNFAYAEEIFITYTHDTGNIIFDGLWTFTDEWKRSSQDIIDFEDGSKLAIRTSHDYDNLYVLIDFISDTSIERLADRGIMCIDGNSDKGNIPKSDDYCFYVAMGSENPITLQGGHLLGHKGHYKKIENHDNLIGIGGISDKYDRYSKTPHATYEFKIPIEIFGRSDSFGFYLGSFDAKTGNIYNWPKDSKNENYPFIPIPDDWGTLVSPDKSIPEFSTSLILLFSLTIGIILSKTFIMKNKIDFRK